MGGCDALLLRATQAPRDVAVEDHQPSHTFCLDLSYSNRCTLYLVAELAASSACRIDVEPLAPEVDEPFLAADSPRSISPQNVLTSSKPLALRRGPSHADTPIFAASCSPTLTKASLAAADTYQPSISSPILHARTSSTGSGSEVLLGMSSSGTGAAERSESAPPAGAHAKLFGEAIRQIDASLREQRYRKDAFCAQVSLDLVKMAPRKPILATMRTPSDFYLRPSIASLAVDHTSLVCSLSQLLRLISPCARTVQARLIDALGQRTVASFAGMLFGPVREALSRGERSRFFCSEALLPLSALCKKLGDAFQPQVLRNRLIFALPNPTITAAKCSCSATCITHRCGKLTAASLKHLAY